MTMAVPVRLARMSTVRLRARNAFGNSQQTERAKGLAFARSVCCSTFNCPACLVLAGVHVLQGKYPQLEIIMLTVLAAADKVFESICNSACGYLLKETPP
jgi:hypothetical protein